MRISLLTKLAVLICAATPAAPPSLLPEPGPFRIVPEHRCEPIFFSGLEVWFCHAAEWWGSSVYIYEWPAEYGPPHVSLADSYSFSAEAYRQQIHFLYTPPPSDTPLTPLPPPLNGGKFHFDIGYQF